MIPSNVIHAAHRWPKPKPRMASVTPPHWASLLADVGFKTVRSNRFSFTAVTGAVVGVSKGHAPGCMCFVPISESASIQSTDPAAHAMAGLQPLYHVEQGRDFDYRGMVRVEDLMDDWQLYVVRYPNAPS